MALASGAAGLLCLPRNPPVFCPHPKDSLSCSLVPGGGESKEMGIALLKIIKPHWVLPDCALFVLWTPIFPSLVAHTVLRAGVTVPAHPSVGVTPSLPAHFSPRAPGGGSGAAQPPPARPPHGPRDPLQTPRLHFAGVGQLMPGHSPAGASSALPLMPLSPTVSPLPDRQAAAAAHPAAAQNQPAAATDPGKGGGHLPVSPFPCWVIAAPLCARLVFPPTRQGDGTCLQCPVAVIWSLCFSPPLPSSRSTCPTS